MSVHWHSYPEPGPAAEAAARHMITLLDNALAGQECATLAVSGGSTPRLLFEQLVKARYRWERVHLFWVDERAVPPADPESNYRLAQENLIGPANIPPRNVHRIEGEITPERAAEHYAAAIRRFFGLEDGETPHFDIVQQGMGPDAHTASLFPGEPLIDDREGICAAVWVPKLSKYRVTLLPGVLLHARHTVVLAAGADKADPLYDVFNAAHDPLKYPSQVDTPHGRNVAWYLDSKAAARLD